jgi:hypothetical protein
LEIIAIDGAGIEDVADEEFHGAQDRTDQVQERQPSQEHYCEAVEFIWTRKTRMDPWVKLPNYLFG